MNVLVIEDDIDIFEVVSLSLTIRWPDTNVVSAPTGEFGLQLVQSEEFDVIILDIGLPDINGFEVCSLIRSFSNIPIVILTVRNRKEDIIRGLELGADDYIVKPFRPEELLARINAILRRIQMTQLKDVELIFQQGSLVIDFRQREVRANSQPIMLGTIEYQILYHLITNMGKVVANQALVDNIWGEEYRERPFLDSPISRLKDVLQEHPQTRKLSLQESAEGYSINIRPG